MEPFVAVTTTLDPDGGGYRQPQIALYANYIRSLARVGVNAVLVTPVHESRAIAELLDACSGLVLTGGEDIEPSRYGEEPVSELGGVNPARDSMEWDTLELALERELPVFGICRGMQLLNVYFGGTLYQDLPTQWDDTVSHFQEAPWGKHHHFVQCEEGSHLHGILGECRPLEINSFHHQAVKELAPNMRCTALANDGLIEGIEATDHDWVVGVQWHPERQEAESPDMDPNTRVLTAFAERARAQRK